MTDFRICKYFEGTVFLEEALGSLQFILAHDKKRSRQIYLWGWMSLPLTIVIRAESLLISFQKISLKQPQR